MALRFLIQSLKTILDDQVEEDEQNNLKQNQSDAHTDKPEGFDEEPGKKNAKCGGDGIAIENGLRVI